MKDKLKQLSAGRIFTLLFVFVITGYFWTTNQRYTLVQGQRESDISRIYGYKVENYSFKYGMRITIWEDTYFERLIPHTVMRSVYDLPNHKIDKVVDSEWIKSDGAVYLNLQITYRDPLDSSTSTEPTSIIYDFHRGEMYIASDFTLWRVWSERLSYDNWMNESEFGEMLSELREQLLCQICPTMRAADGGESARFIGIFLASSFLCSQTLSMPAPPPSNASRWAVPCIVTFDNIERNTFGWH